jgi:hypothetical protein
MWEITAALPGVDEGHARVSRIIITAKSSAEPPTETLHESIGIHSVNI